MTEPQLLSAWAGHWTGPGTGVTVILPPAGTVGSGEVRGGAPATREFALLEPTRLVDRVDAVVLSGGSAFGLAAAEGVMSLLRERGEGFPTPAGPVPIVIGMSIFDGSVRTGPPDAAGGRAAALSAYAGTALTGGRVGAGTGASTGKWRGRLDPGGLGLAEREAGAVRVAAVVAVNAWGDVLGRDGDPLFGGPPGQTRPAGPYAMQNTTVAVVLTDARLSKSDCFLLAQSGHTGFARAIHPAHSRFDGDAVVALATGLSAAEADLDLLRAVTVDTVAAAVRAAVIPPG
ncbi:multidrug transporter [Actinoplanes sp. ATCC 53533]|uniref:P1 family peptidase n=1 Tax=Actinoplanes sp. ATCC 53533 TaxID=1288362 RepID=UPI000F79BED9|nr:P1 family peptidase [Actinoplanes sp. ATCC 53533]RSM58086.1 multidrug transporter [Actinoplanes sp. ATCC 53533]